MKVRIKYMNEPKFYVGDRVVVLPIYNEYAGLVGTIETIDENICYVNFFINGYKHGEDFHWSDLMRDCGYTMKYVIATCEDDVSFIALHDGDKKITVNKSIEVYKIRNNERVVERCYEINDENPDGWVLDNLSKELVLPPRDNDERFIIKYEVYNYDDLHVKYSDELILRAKGRED